MREIKFRAWDGTEFYTPALAEGLIFRSFRDYEDFNYAEHDVIQQYTGLKDKNGTEIYEGDIVKSKNLSGGCSFNIDEVVFEDGGFVVRDTEGIMADMWIGDSDLYDIEIIGNVFQNAELMGQTS